MPYKDRLSDKTAETSIFDAQVDELVRDLADRRDTLEPHQGGWRTKRTRGHIPTVRVHIALARHWLKVSPDGREITVTELGRIVAAEKKE